MLMSALRIERPMSIDELAPVTMPRPACNADAALVRVHAAAINPSDVLNVRGLPITTYPRVPGRDFAGIVAEGPEVLLGSEVWGTGSGDLGFIRDGSHAEYLAVPASALVPVPSGFTLEQAGSSGLAYATAAAGLRRAGVRDRSCVLVTGAAGCVGGAALALAAMRGARVIAAVRNDEERERLIGRIAEHDVLVTAGQPLAEAVRERTDGRGADLAFDTVGNALFSDVVASLAEDGAMVVISATPMTTVDLDLSQFYRRRLTLHGVSSTAADARWCASLLSELVPSFAAGRLPPVAVERTLPLGRAAEGYARVASGEAAGRVVLTPNDGG